GGGNYIYTETSGTCNGMIDGTSILSPRFDLSSISIPGLEFWYHMWGVEQDSLMVQISTDMGTTWTTIWEIQGDQGDEWFKAEVSLSPTYTGVTNAMFRIRATELANASGSATYFTGDVAIDDFKILGLPEVVITDISPVDKSCGLGAAEPITVMLQNNDLVDHDSIPVCLYFCWLI
ncbi:MAG: hypothetical protein ACPGJV_08395, partial [Bacteriovoracaceae bacterium]